jgi:hypothetical protein
MLRSLCERITYANVVATLALFIALATGGAYAANTIASEDIIDGEVKNQDLATDAVTYDKIANANVIRKKIPLGAVDTGRIADGTILDVDLKNSSVTGPKIAPNVVTGSKILDGSIERFDIPLGLLKSEHFHKSGASGLVDFGTLQPQSCSFIEVSASGTAPYDYVLSSYLPSDEAAWQNLVYGDVYPKADAIRGKICNPTSEAIDPPSAIYSFVVIHNSFPPAP